jgi:hypothetical protein
MCISGLFHLDNRKQDFPIGMNRIKIPYGILGCFSPNGKPCILKFTFLKYIIKKTNYYQMSEINRIIFIKDTLFTKRDYDRFGVSLLQKNGFTVDIWEITPVLHQEILDRLDISQRVTCENFTVFSDMNRLRDAIDSLDRSTIVHILIPFTYQTFPIFFALSKKGVYTSTTSLGAVPVPKVYETEPWLSRLLFKGKSIFRYSVKRNFSTVVNQFLLKNYRFFGIKPLTICLSGGTKSTNPLLLQFPHDSTTKIVWGHSFDYDYYLTLRDELVDSKEDYGVFIDQNLPFHPEHLYCDIIRVTSPEDYYPVLHSFFTRLEKEYKCPIIVAAHPTTDPNSADLYFNGRKIVYGNTARLIRNARFVLTHDSTALNFALLFKKPLIFFTTNALEQSIIQQDIDMIAGLLKKEPVNANTLVDFHCSPELVFNTAAYEQYISDYIKTKNSPDAPLWQIYADAVRQLDNPAREQ